MAAVNGTPDSSTTRGLLDQLRRGNPTAINRLLDRGARRSLQFERREFARRI